MNSPLLIFVILRTSLFFVEIFSVQNMFFAQFSKKKHFILKQIIVFLIGLIISVLFALLNYATVRNSEANYAVVISLACLGYFALFAYSVAATYVLYQTRIYTLFFYSTASYAIQHFVFVLYLFILNLTNSNLIIYNYGNLNFLNVMLYLLIYHGSLIIIYFTYVRKITLIRKDETFGSSVIIMFVIAILLNVVLGSIIERYSTNLEGNMMYFCSLILQMLCSFIIVFTQTRSLIQLRIANENKIIIDLLKEKEQEYQFALTNAELISIKAHDLKHQVQALRQGGEQAEKVLKDLEGVIQSYQSIITTGSSVIDVVLTEKWMYCERNDIKLSCTVDPKALEFMDDIDLYSIIGNIVDNAIEAVSKIKNKDKRVITLSISSHAGLATITTNNYYEGDLKMKDGLPVTTKRDSSYHGFGMRSIRIIAEKYHGSIKVTAQDQIFILQITLFK